MNPSERLSFREDTAKFRVPQADRAKIDELMNDKLFAEGTESQLKALEYSLIQRMHVRHFQTELSQLKDGDNPVAAQKQLEGRSTDREMRLKEEEEARRKEKEKEELLNALERIKAWEETCRVKKELEDYRVGIRDLESSAVDSNKGPNRS
ncbi:hypothetical protein CRG98_020811 [Punica granatum]|uniref:Uncharacterized protein n=1 Tax=Punica granatum TaxID=22663 RepID=A0A2I0JRG1_PUNGR|nr:hypothetical protein CRG98_020811 [Punica granatum]